MNTIATTVPHVAFLRNRLWDLSLDLIAVTDAEGRLLATNGAWSSILGWSEAELARKDVLDIVHPDDRAATHAEIAKLKAGEVTQRFESRLVARDGRYRTISWRACPEDGLFYAIGRDITDRIAREQAIRVSQKMEALGQLTGGIAHDFNNLLTIVRSSTEFLKQLDVSDERRVRYVHAIWDASERAVKLTNQLLAFARRQKLEPEVFDVRERIADVSELLCQLVGPLITISTTAPNEPCLVEADLCQFEVALMNLVINAKDAMGGRGRLYIDATRVNDIPKIRNHGSAEGAFVKIAVRDTGTGIAEDVIERIFDPFFTTKEVGRGTGLGLSQVYGFMRQSGGNIQVESQPGAGATFTLYLPRKETPSHQPRSEPIAAHGADSVGRRMLLVEDNAHVGEFARTALADLGYDVAWANNAAEALGLIEAGPDAFDVIVSDVVLPGMSGLELAELIRTQYPTLPLILTSGYSEIMAEEGSRGFAMLPKPYSVHELRNAVECATAKRGRAPNASIPL